MSDGKGYRGTLGDPECFDESNPFAMFRWLGEESEKTKKRATEGFLRSSDMS